MANQSIFRASEKGNLNLVRYFIETERVNVNSKDPDDEVKIISFHFLSFV